ncbi:MAG: phosphoribosylpyrophosphate synthetase [Lewinellaceae bacterium]|nr:phosphoribosylpyrophosphate synthetase [Lewinellaceae bacterium]
MTDSKNITLVDVLEQLKKKGFTRSFKLENKALLCLETGKSYASDALRIVEYHRFEGDSNPADMSVVFAVECTDGEKGAIISSYGTYADMPLITFMDRVKILDRSGVSG